MRRLNPTIIAAIVIGLVLLLVAVAMVREKGPNQDKLSDDQLVAAPVAKPERRCASQATYDRIKRELFRQASQLRRSDQAAFDRLAAASSVRMERPVMTEHDEALGTVRCTGFLSLDLPPGVAVVGGRRTLSTDIDYVLQPAADASGDVVMLEGADAIVVPLATLANAPVAAPAPDAQAPPPEALGEPPPQPTAPSQPPAAVVPPPAQQPPAVATARPSFNCGYARTRGEIAVCGDSGLAALDRQMAAQYFRALSAADARERGILTATRDSFLRYRDRCPTNACIAETYRGRMREIRDIMSGSWRPGN
jgi:uncharacterized protein YecT (DUF1311 family)